MGKRLLKLPRRLLGYQASSVDQLIADRDSMLGVADQRVRSAEARIAELEEELSRRDEDIEAVRSHLEPTDDPAPAPPVSFEGSQDSEEAALVPAGPDDNEAEEIEEWPLPTIRPRTVEFIPPPVPSAEFDPMPIGGEDHEWSSPAVASVWAPEDEGTTDEPAAQVDPWTSGEQAKDQPWTPLEDVAPAYEEHVEPAYEEPADTEAIPEPPQEPLDEPSPEPVVPQLTPAYMSEELAHVVKAAEESATKIIERAWESTRTQIEQVDRLWREVQEEIIRFAAWRQHVNPMISTVQSYIEQARASIEQVPPRIQEALSPAAEALARVDEGMSEFARASDLPQLLGKLHPEVAKTIDPGDFTGSPSATSATEAGFHASDEPAEIANVDPVEIQEPAPAEDHEDPARQEMGTNHQAPSNGGRRGSEGEDMDMARAIAHELRIINESGDPITSPD